jgi:hypothetical protein
MKKITDSNRIERYFEAISNCIGNKSCNTYTRKATRSYYAYNRFYIWIYDSISRKEGIDRFRECIKFQVLAFPRNAIGNIFFMVKKTNEGRGRECINKKSGHREGQEDILTYDVV